MRLPALVLLGAVACAASPPAPAALDTRGDQCGSCRMVVSDARFAAQLVAPDEQPRFFDDVGCLAAYVKAKGGLLPARSAAFVADHRTKAWVSASEAVYTKVTDLATPMASHLIAHANAASREADADARGGTSLSAAELFGGPPPDGR